MAYRLVRVQRLKERKEFMEDLGYIVSSMFSKKRIDHPLSKEVKELQGKRVMINHKRGVMMRRHQDGSIDMEVPTFAIRTLGEAAKEETLKQVREHPHFDPKWLGRSN